MRMGMRRSHQAARATGTSCAGAVIAGESGGGGEGVYLYAMKYVFYVYFCPIDSSQSISAVPRNPEFHRSVFPLPNSFEGL